VNKKREIKEQTAEPIVSKICRILEIPEYSVASGMRIEITSNREAVIENCRGILEYTSERIRLLTPGMTVNFSGKSLSIGSMNQSSAAVTGVIESIEFSLLG